MSFPHITAPEGLAVPVDAPRSDLAAAPRRAMKARRLVDWIWTIRGSLPLADVPTAAALAALEPLFDETGTRFERGADSISFTKKDPDAQDRMSIFDAGTIRVETTGEASVLRWAMTSRMLLLCFLAPILFLAFAGGTILLADHEKALADAAPKPTKAEQAKQKAKDKQHEAVLMRQNPIDKFLGAPAPEKPKKDDDDDAAAGKGKTAKDKAGAGKDKKDDAAKKDDKGGKKDRGRSPVPAYVFAGIFATLFLVGRILEDRLARRLFRRRLFPV